MHADQVVIAGRHSHTFSKHGLMANMACVQEQVGPSCLIELPAALSINLLFEGQIDFSMCGHRYCLGSGDPTKPECSVTVLAEQETLVRHLQKPQRVKKINIFIERQWLEARAATDQQREEISAIFEQHGALRCWQPSQPLIDVAIQLAGRSAFEDYSQSLLTEALTIQLLSTCMEEMKKFGQLAEPVARRVTPMIRVDQTLKSQVNEMISKDFSLEEIADSLGLSISTLQRRFKAKYGMTVIHYCRQHRLEIARQVLTKKGASIGEAAFVAGYNHPSNFVTAFKRRFGMTPTELVKIFAAE